MLLYSDLLIINFRKSCLSFLKSHKLILSCLKMFANPKGLAPCDRNSFFFYSFYFLREQLSSLLTNFLRQSFPNVLFGVCVVLNSREVFVTTEVSALLSVFTTEVSTLLSVFLVLLFLFSSRSSFFCFFPFMHALYDSSDSIFYFSLLSLGFFLSVPSCALLSAIILANSGCMPLTEFLISCFSSTLSLLSA